MAFNGKSPSSAVRAMEKLCSGPRIQVISSKCAVWSCENNTKPSNNVTYFNLPTADKGRCAIWLLNAGRIDLVNLTPSTLSGYVFCENHFEPSQIVQKANNIRKLTKNAIPTLFGLANNLISLSLINPPPPDTMNAEPIPTYFKNSSKPSSISASNAKCYKCSKSYKNCSGITLYFFPVDDPSRYYAWIINSGEVGLLQRSKSWVHHNCLMCSAHFETSQFEENNSGYLRAGAIPTLFHGTQKPTIPAPLRFDKDCRKPFPLLIKAPGQSPIAPKPASPKIAVVHSSPVAKRGRGRPPSKKLKTPEVEVLKYQPPSKAANVSPDKRKESPGSSIMKNKGGNRTYSSADRLNVPSGESSPPKKRRPVKILAPLPPPMKSTILIDATGKPASDHPLANIISTFLAQNKGHTGDLLITDGKPNGIKYLIRQNKPGTALPASTTTTDLPNVSGTSPAFFVSSQVSTSGPTIVRSSVKSLSPSERFETPEPETDSIPDSTKSETSALAEKSSTGVQNKQNASKSSKADSTKSETTSVAEKSSTGVQNKQNASKNAAAVTNSSQPGDAITILVPVSPNLQSSSSSSSSSSTPAQIKTANAKGDVTVLVPVIPAQVNAGSTPVPLSTDGKSNVQAQKSDSQPFTIVQKNVESVKQNGTTT